MNECQLRSDGGAVRFSYLCPVIIKIRKRIFFGLFFININSQSGCFVDKHVTFFNPWCTGEYLPGKLIEINHFLDTEIPDGQIDMSIGRMSNRGSVTRTMPCCSDIEPFSQPGNFHSRGDPSDL